MSRFLSNALMLLCGLLFFVASITTAHAALSAKTANTIEGTKPYLSVAHLADINAGNDFALLGVRFDGNSYFTDSDINNGLIAANVELGNLTPTTFAQKLGDGSTGATSVAYKTPVATTDALDNDGDGFIAGSLTGSVVVRGWYYVQNGTERQLQLTQLTQTFCDLASANIVPYIKLEGPVMLSTQYGAPNVEIYDKTNTSSPLHTSQSGGAGKDPVRKLMPSGGAMACYTKPNLQYNYGTQPEWVGGKGFKLQDKNTPSSNFPRKGFHGAFFDLVLEGVSASDVLTNSEDASGSGKITIGEVTAKLTAAPNTTDTNVLRVMLEGPNHTSQRAFTSPATFKFYAGVSNTNLVYSFELSKWFIAKSGDFSYNGNGNLGNQTVPQYCASLMPANSYRVPSLGEYTNARGGGWSGTLSGWYNNTICLSNRAWSKGFKWSR